MALETLENIAAIDMFPICRSVREISAKTPICVIHSKNVIAFKIQQGPIKEHGKNGCQVDTMIAAVSVIIERLNQSYPSEHNEKALQHLELAFKALKDRKNDRERRGVEGTSQL